MNELRHAVGIALCRLRLLQRVFVGANTGACGSVLADDEENLHVVCVAFLAFCVRAHNGETLLELSADFFLHLSLVGGIEMLEFSVDVGRVCRDVLHDAGLHLSTGSLGVSHLGVGHSLTASDVV